MMRKLIIALLLGSAVSATGLYVLAAATCEQPLYELPPEADPNRVLGALLPPVFAAISDEPSYSILVGPFSRKPRRCCEPDAEDAFTLECDTPGWTVEADYANELWTLSGVAERGPNYVYLRATDNWGDVARFTMFYVGRDNRLPVLH